MKQYTIHQMRSILKHNGYQSLRQRGSHEIWSNGIHTISLPVVALKAVIAHRLIKENELKIGS